MLEGSNNMDLHKDVSFSGSIGCQTKRWTKENLDRDCGKRLSGTWIEQGGCHGL